MITRIVIRYTDRLPVIRFYHGDRINSYTLANYASIDQLERSLVRLGWTRAIDEHSYSVNVIYSHPSNHLLPVVW